MIATGTFEVRLEPQTSDGDADAASLDRLSIAKRFDGDLAATSTGEMLTAVTPTDGSAGYVALERVSGILGGKRGSFVLQHSGLMDRGSQSLTIVVVPDSGTAELAGISGSMSIRIEDGRHFYELAYSLPSQD